jgi:hypothetical protein
MTTGGKKNLKNNNNSNTTNNIQLDREEAFSTLLVRIQRQYGATTTSSSNGTTGAAGGSNDRSNTHLPLKPPDEAAVALGKGLALSFVGMAESSQSSSASASGSSSLYPSNNKQPSQQQQQQQQQQQHHHHHRNDRSHITMKSGVVIPKNIQEKTLLVLSNRDVNPSVCRAFFDTLIQQQQQQSDDEDGRPLKDGNPISDRLSSTSSVNIHMEVWLPTWILFTEQTVLKELEESNNHDDYDDDYGNGRNVSFDPLTCMIRAYAQCIQILSVRESRRYVVVPSNDDHVKYDESNDDDRVGPERPLEVPASSRNDTKQQQQYQHNHLLLRQQQQQRRRRMQDPRILTHPTSYIGTVARTYTKLQTQVGRLAMVREFTNLAFLEPETRNFRLMLTPLITSSVLSTQPTVASMAESILCMEGVWRETYVLVFDRIDGDNDNNNDTTTNDRHEDDGRSSYSNEQGKGGAPPPSYMVDIILWLTETLNLFLLTVPSRKADTRIACKELAHRWLAMVLDLGAFVSQAVEAAGTNDTNEIRPTGVGVVGGGNVVSSSRGGINIPEDETTSPTEELLLDQPDRDNDDEEESIDKEQGQETELPDHLDSETREEKVSRNDHYLREQKSIRSKQLARWFEGVLAGTLVRWFTMVPSYRISMEILSVPLQNLAETYGPRFSFSLVTTLRLATLAMSNPSKDDVKEILSILATSISGQHQHRVQPIAFAVLRGLGSIFLRDEVCADTTKNLLLNLSRTKRTKSPPIREAMKVEATTTSKDLILTNLIQLSQEDPTVTEELVQFVSSSIDNHPDIARRFSVMQQVGSLIFGIGLLDDVSHRSFAFAFLKNILLLHPHLGVSLLPVMVDSINASAIRGESHYMIEQITFLCEVVVRDTQCALEVWNLLGVELMGESIPSVIRATLIRLFPKICISNKRLYKRIINSMGTTLGKCADNTVEAIDSLELRLAVAATLSDLARDDHIRDPTDVIGWIQAFITDAGWVRSISTSDKQNSHGMAALVHYAILSLHYFVIAQELDFNVVMVVLNKRLCSIHDMNEVSKLPPLVLESLILLMGDGEVDASESEDDEDKPKRIGVSPQASKSVHTLLNLWNSKSLRPQSSNLDPMTRITQLNCRNNVYISLTKYSFDALGVDEAGIRAVVNAASSKESDTTPKIPHSGIRYNALKSLIEDGIAILETVESEGEVSPSLAKESTNLGHDTDSNISDSLATFISKLTKIEEETLGSNLWQKRSTLKKKGPKKQYGSSIQVSFNPTQPKPTPTPASILKTYNDNKCQATSVAALLSFEGKSLGLLSDLAGDTTSDPSDPMAEAFFVQGWLNAARTLLVDLVASMSSSELLDKLLFDIQEWRLDTPDSMYMCMSCLALLIPEILGPYGDHSSYVKDIADDVWEAYKGHVFEDSNVAKLCLGLVGVSVVKLGNEKRLIETVSCLENAVTGYGGQSSFGSYFGLAVIAQACAGHVNAGGDDETQSYNTLLISRIVGFLIKELSRCFKGSHDAFDSLVDCIKVGSINPDVIDALTALKKKSMKVTESKKHPAMSIFIAFAICLPSLTKVNEELLLGVFCCFESLEWGCGKGIALPSVLQACRSSGIFESREIERMYAKYAKVFEQGMEQGVDGLWDIFYAVTSIQSKSIPYSIRKFMVGNRNLFDERGRAVSLISAVVSISTIPCLGGRGTGNVTEAATLSQSASDDDVAGVVESLVEGTNSVEWNKYSQMATMLLGFMASMAITQGIDQGSSLRLEDRMLNEQARDTPLPVAVPGTVLEILMAAIQMHFQDADSIHQEKPNQHVVKLLGSLQVLSLPGHFADFLEQLMIRGGEEIKHACVTLLLSQVSGRPRAVFDGQEFVTLAAKISRMPPAPLRAILGENEAAEMFVGSFAEMMSKFASQSIEEAAENIFRYCMNMVGHNSGLIEKYLLSMKDLMHRTKDVKFVKFSPKVLNTLQMFLLQRVFAGIRNASWTSGKMGHSDQRIIIETYASCLLEIPAKLLLEADFFSVKDLDGFFGESLRIRVVMVLVQNDHFASATHSYGEIASAIAWICRQLVACDDDIYSSTILQVVCTIAKASSKESAAKKNDLLISLLDNLLLVSTAASFVGLQVLAALLFQWCYGRGSDGDLSLSIVLGTSIDKWHDMPTILLHEAFRLAVHDLPFNLAKYARSENLSGVLFNRLWRIYIKWRENGADDETLFHFRRALVSCRDADSGGIEDMVTLTTSMVIDAT